MSYGLPRSTDLLATSLDAESSTSLLKALEVLFEPSPALVRIVSDILSPDEAPWRARSGGIIDGYSKLIDISLDVIATWDDASKAGFIAGHPRIGAVEGLSHLSAREQAAVATPPAVLVRLGHLNACYEHRYPGLRYITFVNGRSREAIKEEIEGVLGLQPSLSPDQPPVESVGVVEVGGEEWKDELERAVADVGKIARSRLTALRVH